MSIILIGGDGGTGKSYQVLRYFPEPIAYFDMEFPRGKNVFKRHAPERIIELFPCREFYKKSEPAKKIKKGQVDVKKSHELLLSSVDTVLDKSNEYQTIVIDGVSDVRSSVADVWLMNCREKNTKCKDRKTIGKDPHAWSEVNKEVENEILFPIINVGRMEDINIVFTAQKEDEYKTINLESGKEDTAKSGKRVINTQNWLTFEMDTTIDLEATEKGKWYMTCQKSPIGVIPKQDITNKSIYDVLLEKGAL